MAQAQPAVTAAVATEPVSHDEMLARVGQMTRMLHDNLRGLGFDKLIAKAAHDIPDARDRLDYVAKMTEQAAQRVLNATETATPLQERIDADASALAVEWRSAMEVPFSEQQYRAAAARTLAFLDVASADANATKQHLLDIMMAQDFQDLTGQVIKKMMDMIRTLEQELLQVLIDNVPADRRVETPPHTLLNGPQINPEGKADVVSDQSQVDDLLASLGF